MRERGFAAFSDRTHKRKQCLTNLEGPCCICPLLRFAAESPGAFCCDLPDLYCSSGMVQAGRLLPEAEGQYGLGSALPQRQPGPFLRARIAFFSFKVSPQGPPGGTAEPGIEWVQSLKTIKKPKKYFSTLWQMGDGPRMPETIFFLAVDPVLLRISAPIFRRGLR